MSGDLLGKEKTLHLDWGKKLHGLCDLLILGPSLSFPVGLDPFFHTKMDLQMGPVTTPFSPQVDKSPTAFSMNPLSLEGLWTLLPEPYDSYVRTLDMSATTISPEGVHQPLVFLALLVSMLKSVLRTSVWLLISCIHTLTEEEFTKVSSILDLSHGRYSVSKYMENSFRHSKMYGLKMIKKWPLYLFYDTAERI